MFTAALTVFVSVVANCVSKEPADRLRDPAEEEKEEVPVEWVVTGGLSVCGAGWNGREGPCSTVVSPLHVEGLGVYGGGSSRSVESSVCSGGRARSAEAGKAGGGVAFIRMDGERRGGCWRR